MTFQKKIKSSAKTVSKNEAQIRLEALCAKGERCTFELRQKLFKWKISDDEANEIIDKLISSNFLNEERFVRAFVNDKIRFSYWGPRKIITALYSKRINNTLIQKHLSEFDKKIIEENLTHLLLLKSRTIHNAKTFEGRTKLFRYGISRGYYPEMIRTVILKHFV